jgi:hypothetical protein
MKEHTMKCVIIFLFCVSSVLAYGQAAAPSNNSVSGSHAGDEQTIRQRNEAVLKAYNLGDVATLDRIEDSDFLLTGDFGEVTKSQQLDDVRQRKDNASTVRLIVANVRFRFYGDTALLTEVERYGEGDDFPKFETTSVWVRRGMEAGPPAFFQAEQVSSGLGFGCFARQDQFPVIGSQFSVKEIPRVAHSNLVCSLSRVCDI